MISPGGRGRGTGFAVGCCVCVCGGSPKKLAYPLNCRWQMASRGKTPPPTQWGRRGAGQRSWTPPTAQDPKAPGGLQKKVSRSTVDKEKAAKETGEEELAIVHHYFAFVTALLCCFYLIFAPACLTICCAHVLATSDTSQGKQLHACCCDCLWRR